MNPVRGLRLVGALLSAAACAYVGWRLWNSPVSADLFHRPGVFAVVALGTAVAFAANLMLALGWAATVRHFDPGAIGLSRAVALYAWTQMGKYLPGNVFHFVGRYGLGRSAGVSHQALAAATVIEPLGLAGLAAIVALPFLGGWLAAHGQSAAILAVAALAAVGVAVMLVIRFKKVRAASRRAMESALSFLRRRGMGVAGLYAGFFLLNGYLVWRLLDFYGTGTPAAGIWSVVSANAFAWVLGYVTIGAPAGVGIREVALIFALGPDPHGSLAACAALYRVSSLLGDFLFFLAGAAGLRLVRRPS